MMDLNTLKNDTARKNAIRDTLAMTIFNAMVVEFGTENVLLIPKAICVGENGAKISGGSVAVRVGTVADKNGFEVDAVAICGSTVKGWNDVCTKSGRVTLAVNMDDIAQAIADTEN